MTLIKLCALLTVAVALSACQLSPSGSHAPATATAREAHVGMHEPSRMQAIADTKRFIDQQLTR